VHPLNVGKGREERLEDLDLARLHSNASSWKGASALVLKGEWMMPICFRFVAEGLGAKGKGASAKVVEVRLSAFYLNRDRMKSGPDVVHDLWEAAKWVIGMRFAYLSIHTIHHRICALAHVSVANVPKSSIHHRIHLTHISHL